MDHKLDAKRLLCPMPVIKAQNAIKSLTAGDRLTVTCTDPGAKSDIPAWCRVHGHQLESVIEDGNEIKITILVCK